MKKIRQVTEVWIHPVEGYQELKFQRYQNRLLVIMVALCWFVIDVMRRQLYGFRFNQYNPDKLNIAIQFLSTVGLLVLFCVANWAVGTLADGEGKFGEIITFVSIALIPFLGTRLLEIGLSNLLTLEESMFLTIFKGLGTLWSAVLLFHAIRIVHNYSSLRTLFIFLLSVLMVLIIVFVLLLLISLGGQIVAFINSVYSELNFRR